MKLRKLVDTRWYSKNNRKADAATVRYIDGLITLLEKRQEEREAERRSNLAEETW